MTYFNGDGCGSRIVRDHAGHCRELQVRLEVLVPDCESADVYQATGPLAGTPDSPAAGPRRFRRRHRPTMARPDRPAAQAPVMGTGRPDLRRPMVDRPAFRLYRADPLLPISAHRPTHAGAGACEFRPTQIRCGSDSASSAASHRVH